MEVLATYFCFRVLELWSKQKEQFGVKAYESIAHRKGNVNGP